MPAVSESNSPPATAAAHGRRIVQVHLTPIADVAYDKDGDMRDITDPSRWPDFYAVTPARLLWKLLREHLNRAPDQVTVKSLSNGDIGVLALDGAYPNWPLAYIYHGLTFAEAEAALADIRRGVIQ